MLNDVFHILDYKLDPPETLYDECENCEFMEDCERQCEEYFEEE